MRAALWVLWANVYAVGAAGCLGPAEEVGAAGVTPAAAYAVRIDSSITVQHTPPGKPAEAPMTIQAAVRGILHTAVDGAPTGAFELCRLDLPPVDGRKLVFRDDLWPRIAWAPVRMTPGAAPDSWNLEPWAILMGLRGMANPATDPLPTDPNDPRVDRVEDDKPGVRISIQVRAYGDPRIDASVRVRFPTGTVALAPDGRMVGEVGLVHDVWVWYADMPWPISDRDAAAANGYMTQKLAEWPILSQHHAWTGVPMDPAAGCAAAMAAN